MKNRVPTLILVGGILIIGMGVFLYAQLASRKATPVKGPATVQTQAQSQASIVFETLKRKSPHEGWGRNPFFRPGEKFMTPEKSPSPGAMPLPPPPGSTPSPLPVPAAAPKVVPLPEEKPPAMKLEMILTVGDEKVAILNGRQVKEGDRLGEEVVFSIEADRVILQKNGKRRTIQLDPFPVPLQVEKRRS